MDQSRRRRGRGDHQGLQGKVKLQDAVFYSFIEDEVIELNIKDSDTHALAKRLASLTRESMAKAVKRAIQEKLAKIEKMQGGSPLADELDRIALHCARLPRRDGRSADEIIGYDENGLPA